MKLKRLIASMLCACMLVAACSINFVGVAFAADDDGADLHISNTPSVTGISMTGTSFDVYEVFSAEIVTSDTDDGTTIDSFDYSVNADYIDFFEKAINDYTYPLVNSYQTGDYSNEGATNAAGTVNPDYTAALDTANNAAMEYINGFYDSDTQTMQDLVALLRTYTLTNSITATATTSVATALTESSGTQTVSTSTGDLLGYYLVLDSSDALDADGETTDASSSISAGMLCNIPAHATDGSLTADVSITIKASAPTISKQIWDNDGTGSTSLYDGSTGAWADIGDYQVGDTVEFLITATIPTDLTGYTSETYTYVIEDAMTDGLDFAEGSVVIYTTSNFDNNETVTSSSHTLLENAYYTDKSQYEADEVVLFTYQFDMVSIKENYPQMTEFYIYYQAVVTEDAKVSADGYETNTVELIYSTNPYDATEVASTEDSVYSYTFALDVLKTSGDGVTPLSGATFALYELNASGEGSRDQLYLVYDGDLSDVYEVPVYYIDVTRTASTSAGVVITDATGEFMILGLDDNTTYRLSEISAPTGYNAADPITFIINAAYSTNTNTGEPTVSVSTTNASIDVSSTGNLATTVINTSSALLPTTGGIGTTLFTYGGIILMVGAGTALFIKRKKS